VGFYLFQIISFKDETARKAEQIILTDFPMKIKEITEKLQSPMFTVKDLSQMHHEIDIPIHPSVAPVYVNGVDGVVSGCKRKRVEPVDEDDTKSIDPKILSEKISINPKIEEIINFLKPEIVTVINYCSTLKLWIQLMIPKIEDGNNFGVSIQEDILSEVTKAETDATTYLDQTTRYFTLRGKMVSKILKYPSLGDYRRSVNEYDEKVYFSFKLILTELRNIYMIIYDVVIKNYVKLNEPRSSNTTSLY
jgi:proteasome activator subunit 3 (PA28 gamma)